MRPLLIILPLLGLLAGSAYFAIYAFSIEGPPMPVEGKVAMGLGIFFSLLVGCGQVIFPYGGPSCATRTRRRLLIHRQPRSASTSGPIKPSRMRYVGFFISGCHSRRTWVKSCMS